VNEVTTFTPFVHDLLYIKRVKGKPLMATRSRIGIELKDGSILSAYHHWDGYPQWLGRILKTNYNSRDLASELIDGGDMSSCWSDKVWGKDRTDGQKYGPEYYSQRGEDCPPRYDETREEFLSYGEEFSYIFTSAGWVCYDMNEFNDKSPELTEIPSGALAV
tara:strand:+ start:104 stop:589 length:486 start_codon:yes stop_codon:yes gene_type:complete